MNKQHNDKAQNLDGMTRAAIGFYMSAFWPLQVLQPQDRVRVEPVIRNLISGNKYYFNNYIAFCEKVMLYRSYLKQNQRAIRHFAPAQWIHSAAHYGLAEKLYRSLQVKRVKEPLYKIQWKGLAESVLDLVEEEPSRNIFYWTKWLEKRSAKVEINILQSFSFILNYKSI